MPTDAIPDNAQVLLEHGGITVAFALGLLWMLQRVGMRLIAAIDGLAKKVEEHTAADAAVAARLARLEGVLTGRESVTPIEGVPIVPQAGPATRSSPVGAYGPFRPKTEPGGSR